jgi:hypothetical protein
MDASAMIKANRTLRYEEEGMLYVVPGVLNGIIHIIMQLQTIDPILNYYLIHSNSIPRADSPQELL